MIIYVSALLLPRLFKSDSIDHLYFVEREPVNNEPTFQFFTPLTPGKPTRCRVMKNHIKVIVVEEGELTYVSLLACLMSAYYAYCVEYRKELRNSLLNAQYHLLHIDEGNSLLLVKSMANLMYKYFIYFCKMFFILCELLIFSLIFHNFYKHEQLITLTIHNPCNPSNMLRIINCILHTKFIVSCVEVTLI